MKEFFNPRNDSPRVQVIDGDLNGALRKLLPVMAAGARTVKLKRFFVGPQERKRLKHIAHLGSIKRSAKKYAAKRERMLRAGYRADRLARVYKVGVAAQKALETAA